MMKSKKKKISSILPAALLSEATNLTRLNQTDTLVLALAELIRTYKRESIVNLKGKLKIKFNVEQDRERSRF
jgi:hypothetical protein